MCIRDRLYTVQCEIRRQGNTARQRRDAGDGHHDIGSGGSGWHGRNRQRLHLPRAVCGSGRSGTVLMAETTLISHSRSLIFITIMHPLSFFQNRYSSARIENSVYAHKEHLYNSSSRFPSIPCSRTRFSSSLLFPRSFWSNERI